VQQRVASELPTLQDEVRMAALTQQINKNIGYLNKTNGDKVFLKEKLGRLLMRGADVKHPTEEFSQLLREAIQHIRSV